MARMDFITEMEALGYDTQEQVSGTGRMMFEFTVPEGVGPNAGRKIWVGTIVGEDYPATPPTSPFFKIQGHTTWLNSTRNVGGRADFGNEWSYWSRQMNAWGQLPKKAESYLHILRKFLIDM